MLGTYSSAKDETCKKGTQERAHLWVTKESKGIVDENWETREGHWLLQHRSEKWEQDWKFIGENLKNESERETIVHETSVEGVWKCLLIFAKFYAPSHY